MLLVMGEKLEVQRTPLADKTVKFLRSFDKLPVCTLVMGDESLDLLLFLLKTRDYSLVNVEDLVFSVALLIVDLIAESRMASFPVLLTHKVCFTPSLLWLNSRIDICQKGPIEGCYSLKVYSVTLHDILKA